MGGDDVHDGGDPTGILPVGRPQLSDLLEGEPTPPYAFLVVLSGAARGTTLIVDRLPAEIGRSAEVDLVIGDETVSRHHAVLRGDRATLELEDLGSSNGTAINGNPMVGALTLLDGDLVSFGSATALVKRVG